MKANAELGSRPENLPPAVIVARGITQEYGGRKILDDLSVSMENKDRIVLLGSNGSGKSTLMGILAGRRQPDQGNVTRQGQVAYLPQTHFYPPEETVFTVTTRNIPQQAQALEVFETTSSRLHDPQSIADFATAQGILEHHQAYDLREQIVKELTEIGLEGIDLSTTLGSLSGGERMKLDLVSLFLGKPDLILLDEPTNHLDLETRFWLESKLDRWPGGLLLISHDRHLLRKVGQITWEIGQGQLQIYGGDYQFYLAQKDIEAKAKEREITTANKEHQKARRGRIGQQATNENRQKSQSPDSEKLVTKGKRAKAAGRGKKRVQKAQQEEATRKRELIQVKKRGPQFRGIRVEASQEKGAGSLLLNLEEIDVPFGDEPGLEQVSLKIHQGDRTALFGPNGSGKSSLLGKVKDISGKQAHLRAELVDQDYSTLAKPDETVLQVAIRQTGQNERSLRHHLASFLFRTNDDVTKPVEVLSGGEAGRLNLALATAKQSNLLILDEPTNNLDLDSLEAIEQALIGFKGAVLIVSHDLVFLENIGIRSSFFIVNKGLKELVCNPGENSFESELRRYFHY